jgi:1-deoxy-D-xylulose-5-phosphate synthase
MWDMSLLQIVPRLHLAAPRDGTRLRELLREAVAIGDAPSVVRFPKGPVCADLDAIDRVGACDVLSRDDDRDVLVVAVGAFGHLGCDTADRIRAAGHGVTVVDPRWVKPVDPALIELGREYRVVVTIEDNGVHGGVGSAITQAMRSAGVETPVRVHGVEQEFLDHAKRDVILQRLGLTPEAIAADTLAAL